MILRNWKKIDPKILKRRGSHSFLTKIWSQYKCGNQETCLLVAHWTAIQSSNLISFAISYVQNYMALSQNLDLRDSSACVLATLFSISFYLPLPLHQIFPSGLSYNWKPGKNSPNILKNPLLFSPIFQSGSWRDGGICKWERTKLPELLQVPLFFPRTSQTKTDQTKIKLILLRLIKPRFHLPRRTIPVGTTSCRPSPVIRDIWALFGLNFLWLQKRRDHFFFFFLMLGWPWYSLGSRES